MDVQNLIEGLVKKTGSGVAAAERLKVSPATLSRLRRGKNLPSRETYKVLCDLQEKALKKRGKR